MVTWSNMVQPTAYAPNTFDQFDPATWPNQEQWPVFDISNPLTWPEGMQTQPISAIPGVLSILFLLERTGE